MASSIQTGLHSTLIHRSALAAQTSNSTRSLENRLGETGSRFRISGAFHGPETGLRTVDFLSGTSVVDVSLPSSHSHPEAVQSNSTEIDLSARNFADPSSADSEIIDGGNEVPLHDELWLTMRSEARSYAECEPALASYLYSAILAHTSLERALGFHLGNKISSKLLLSTQLATLMLDAFNEDEDLRNAIRRDLLAVRDRDAACTSFIHCFLNFKGFQAIQVHRVAHKLWLQGRESLALALQSRVSEVFQVDIHPAAGIGHGIMFDHATGVVIGETASIGNDVSILHHVTLGGTGAAAGDRHPKIGDGVLIGAGAIILGNVKVGDGAKIGAGSVVLTDIPPHTTAVGVPARLVGGKASPKKNQGIPSKSMDHTSFIEFWSDYVI